MTISTHSTTAIFSPFPCARTFSPENILASGHTYLSVFWLPTQNSLTSLLYSLLLWDRAARALVLVPLERDARRLTLDEQAVDVLRDELDCHEVLRAARHHDVSVALRRTYEGLERRLDELLVPGCCDGGGWLVGWCGPGQRASRASVRPHVLVRVKLGAWAWSGLEGAGRYTYIYI